jgi:hypothetical protein
MSVALPKRFMAKLAQDNQKNMPAKTRFQQ